MKRLVALLLTLVLVMSLFAACDSGKKKDKDDDDDETTEATGVVSTDDVVKPIVDPTDDNQGNAVTKPVPDNNDAEGIDGTWVADISLGELMGDETVPSDITVEFKCEIDGDDVTMSVDEKAMKNALKDMVEAMCDANGMSEDDFYAAINMTEDEFIESAMSEFGGNGTMTGTVEDFEITQVDDDTIDVDGMEFKRD